MQTGVQMTLAQHHASALVLKGFDIQQDQAKKKKKEE